QGSWDQEDVKVRASRMGRWTASLRTPDAGGPYTVTVTSGSEITLDNVMVGEVWICSGQSNMEWSMTASADGRDDIAGADVPGVRSEEHTSELQSRENLVCRL